MRQGDGSELLGANDPRREDIGVIYVAPTDDRRDVLTAIHMQEKLGRKQVAIVLPEQNKAFRQPVDFDGLKNTRRSLKAQIVFIAPAGPGPAEFARQRRFAVYSSLENYTKSLQDNGGSAPKSQRRGWRFPNKPARAANGGPAFLDRGAQHPEAEMEPLAPRPRDAEPADPDLYDEPEDEHAPFSPGAAAAIGLAGGLGLGALAAEEEHAAHQTASSSTPSPQPDPGFGSRFSANQPGGPPPAAVGPVNYDDDEDLDSLPATSSDASHIVDGSLVAAGAGAAAGVAAANVGTADAAGTPGGPGIIQFPQSRGRITAKLPTPNASANASSAPIQTRQRNTGKMAAAAAVGAGAALAGRGAVSPPPPITPPRRGRGSGGGAPRQRRSRWPLLLLLLLLLLLTLGGGTAWLAYTNPGAIGPVATLLPFGAPSATVTITPDSHDLKNQYLVTGVVGIPSAAQREIQARQLSANPKTRSQTATATGHGQTQGLSATGLITFTNGRAQVQTVSKGTVFLARGMNVVTDARADIPAANLNSGRFGSAQVRAHVVQTGTAGNIPAGAINVPDCCGGNGTIAARSSAFSGGQDQTSFTFVQQSDIDGLAGPMKSQLSQEAQQQFNSQIRANEHLTKQPQCKTNVTSNQNANDHADSVTVTVSATCTGEAYDYLAAQNMGSDLLKQEALKQPGAGYVLIGDLVTTIGDVTVIDNVSGKLSINVFAEGVWAYQFSDTLKRQLAQQIAGKSKSAAGTLLLQQTGVKQTDIQIQHGNGDILPTDASQITIIIQSVTGIQPGPTPGTGSPTQTTGSPPATTPTTAPPATGTPNNQTPTGS